MDKVEVSFSNVDALVFVSQSPDYIVPHTSAVLQAKLGIPTSAIAIDLNFGCAGYVYGLFQSMMYIATGYAKNVLLLVSDTMSRRVHPKDKSLRLVIGDGGTATFLTAKDDSLDSKFTFFTDGNGAKYLTIPAGGARVPLKPGKTDVLLGDDDGNFRTAENIYMDGRAIMDFALEKVPSVIYETLDKMGWEKDDVDLFAIHQANAFMVKYLAKLMKIPICKAPVAVKFLGNTSAASIPLMLSSLYAGNSASLKKVVVCGFGTGLACAAGTVNLSQTHIMPIIEI